MNEEMVAKFRKICGVGSFSKIDTNRNKKDGGL